MNILHDVVVLGAKIQNVKKLFDDEFLRKNSN